MIDKSKTELGIGLTPAEDVRKNYKNNKYNRWFSTNESHTCTAERRYQADFFECASNINKDKYFSLKSKVFTMGSCFARNIEKALREHKIDVLSDRLSIDPELYVAPRSPSAAMNKFNIPSMKNEFMRAFGKHELNDDPFIYLNDGSYFDTSTAGLKISPIDPLRKVQKEIAEYNKCIIDADVFIVTLGLVEMFVDNVTGCVLNTSPHPLVMRKYPGRFDHYRPNYEHLKKLFDEMLDLIFTNNENLEVVVTVSPVPLQSTMTSDDVVVTNTYSKSLLRVLAQSSAIERQNVSYFPSYEMVVNSPRESTWEDDCIHVKSDTVSKITNLFVNEWFV
ncbi:MAG: GSCFA domain-containing protein [Candidatus Thiodiazotropha sp. (ex Myrtea spinifera)]|nr:GSCFA domain-containing protein [Candidatus Thiodiazotropha sp. (ex Myrtea spinifera)]